MTRVLRLAEMWMTLVFCVGLGCFLAVPAEGEDGLTLAGSWRFQLDPEDRGLAEAWWQRAFDDSLELPTTTARAGKGEPAAVELGLEGPAMRYLHQRFRYVGPAWYQRTIEIPVSWANREVMLTLERVIWQSRVWVNGEPVEPAQDSLSVPHRHQLGAQLKPGEVNTITVRIDNRSQVDIGVMGHAYTDETQTIWNGMVGKLELVALPDVRIQHLRVRPILAERTVKVVAECFNRTKDVRAATATLRATPEFDGDAGESMAATLSLPPGESTHQWTYPMPEGAATWSEFSPRLYTLRATLEAGAGPVTYSRTFGMRSFTADGQRLLINGRPTFLRGNLECAIFPKTGHPDMSGEQWEHMYRTARDHGLNHLRFHSWCPPEVAFAMADRYGFYLQVELPNWTFRMGKNAPVDAFLRTEGERILREYGHHPSFVMLSLGNELKGDLNAMDALIDHFRSIEPDLLYTSTSYAFSPRGRLPGRSDDFFISQRTKSGWVRGQGFLNQNRPNTRSDYAEGLSCLDIPLVTHEVGQYVVYPNLAELPKYESSPFRATAWEAIRADLDAKGQLHEAARYTRDSGAFAALLYKEDLERAMRTRDLAGIQLLQLQDFPGQSTATVGLLDAFWDSKDVITAEAFRRFCGPTVPLARMDKRVWQDDEVFVADLEAAHFGPEPILNAQIEWRLLDRGKVIAEDRLAIARLPLGNGTPLGTVRVPLHGVEHAAKLSLEVRIPEANAFNNWAIWTYPASSADASAGAGAWVGQWADAEAMAALAAGRRVVLLPPVEALKKALPARFIPVFWSPLHFPNQPGTLGATIDADHPLWAEFPTDSHSDWQWWELTAESMSLDLEGLDPAIAAPFRFIDKFNRNALPAAVLEARVGPGKLLICTLDVTTDLEHRPVARYLRRCLMQYAASDGFEPTGTMSADQLASLISAGAKDADASPEGRGDVRDLGVVPGFND